MDALTVALISAVALGLASMAAVIVGARKERRFAGYTNEELREREGWVG